MKTLPTKTMAGSAAKGQKRKRAATDVAVTAGAECAEVIAAPAGEAMTDTRARERVATPATVVLAANCSIRDVAALRQSLGTMVDAPEPIAIDASAVERIDTATVQLLYAFIRDRIAADREVVWQGVTTALADAVRLLGMRDLICLPTADELAA